MTAFSKSLQIRLLAGFLALALVPAVIIGYMAYESGRRSIVTNVKAQLESVATLKKQAIDTWSDHMRHSVIWIANDPQVIRDTVAVARPGTSKEAYKRAYQSLLGRFQRLIALEHFFQVLLLDPSSGQVVVASDPLWEGKVKKDDSFFVQAKKEIYLSEVFLSLPLGKPAMVVAGPVSDAQGKLAGVVAAYANLDKLSEIMLERSGLGKTAETFLINRSNLLVTNTVFAPDGAFKKWIFDESAKQALKGKTAVDQFLDYRDVPVIGAYLWLPDRRLALIAKQDASEAFAPVVTLGKQIMFLSAGIALIALVLGFLLARMLFGPLRQVEKGVQAIDAGDLNYRINLSAQNEIGALAQTFDQMAENLMKATATRKRAELEKEKLQAQLVQSQKMEAIGRLAGGVAHDFNNLMAIVIGYADMALSDHQIDDGLLRGNIEEIKMAGQRAADVTRQLLAFSRKQVISPAVLDLNTIVSEMDKMLRRLIGEDIELQTHLDPNLDEIWADTGQIEQILMNLAINAKDAMPYGGKLTIETRNIYLDEGYASSHGIELQPNHYVLLSVSDNGMGMDKETLSQIFEPFYTTKQKGKGTGLGLSTAYGIVKQNKGLIWVYSEPDRGATFKIYLPRFEGEARPVRGKQANVAQTAGSETVLVVEDDNSVCNLAKKILQAAGYRVFDAANGADALRVCQEHAGPINLLITDVIMPGMSGREAAQQIISMRPEIKVLYMSGYTDNAIAHHGVLDSKIDFIEKPFSPKSLARKVRQVLDQQDDQETE